MGKALERALQRRMEEELVARCKKYVWDPETFVRWAFPWGSKGSPLQDYPGPDEWQTKFLLDLGRKVRKNRFDGVHSVEPIREAVSSGHGIGKGVLTGMLAAWILSTRPESQGTITANTYPQLRSKTWATVCKWVRMCITSHWFEIGAERIAAKCAKDSWFVTAQTCSKENSEAFQGQHAATSTSWYVFDEASAIPREIWEAAEGGLTDGEPMWFCWGQPTRNSGMFYEAVFGKDRGRWHSRVIDSRECQFPNKETIKEWVESKGEDSDFVRVRVRGLAPRVGDLQYIGTDLVTEAQKRDPMFIKDDPLVVGFDVARGGMDQCVIRFRRGRDARTIPPIRVPGENARDTMLMVSLLTEVLTGKKSGGVRPSAVFVDSGFGGPIVDRVNQMGYKNVYEVNFGGKSPDAHFANMRAFMWGKMAEALGAGLAIDKDPTLETDLTGPGYHHNQAQKLVLESKEDMKKRGLDSPDDGDALALTFAAPVAPRRVGFAPPPSIPADLSERRWMV
jgi:hypothetical protein